MTHPMGPAAALAEVARELSLLAAATPSNARVERARVVRAFAAGGEAAPRWVYSAYDTRALRAHRRRVVGALEELARRGDPTLAAWRARCEELLVECDAIEAVGTPALGAVAERRFGDALPGERDAADATARAWTAGAPDADDAPVEASDAPTRTSLLGRVEAEVARLRLPFEVRASDALTALAATGERTIWVATERPITARVARRTALHEVHGHAVPRVRARSMPHALFVVGTARGADDQEGWALELERRAGLLDAHRRFELAVRHRAVSGMRAGGSFVDVVRSLRALGAEVEPSVRAAERAFRGSDGRAPGLGRERVYLEAYARVRARLARAPADEALLSSGQVSVASIEALRAALRPALLKAAPPAAL